MHWVSWLSCLGTGSRRDCRLPNNVTGPSESKWQSRGLISCRSPCSPLNTDVQFIIHPKLERGFFAWIQAPAFRDDFMKVKLKPTNMHIAATGPNRSGPAREITKAPSIPAKVWPK